MTEHPKATDLSEALRWAWGDIDQQQRPGPKRSLSLEAVLAAGVALYDQEGVAGFSLARLAKSLALTTNALYRYVESREELEALVRDTALGKPELAAMVDWQDAVRQWARELERRYRVHSWLAYVPVRIPFTPNALAWLDALLRPLEAAGLDAEARLAAAGLLDDHVRACAVAMFDLEGSKPTQVPDNFPDVLQARGLEAVSALFRSGMYASRPAERQTMLEFGVENFLRGVSTTRQG
jgi:AcrR family transcriptional regulator